jgi:hypothetical protein
MPEKNTLLKQFSALTWSDLEEWAGSPIVGRGRSHQHQAQVSGLSLAEDMQKQIQFFLKDKTKTQLIELISGLAGQHPEMAEDSANAA